MVQAYKQITNYTETDRRITFNDVIELTLTTENQHDNC